MGFVEDAKDLQAKGYARPLKYTVDKTIPGAPRTFRYVFDQGGLRCSASAEHTDRICYVPRGSPTTIARESPSFVYVDVGCWADDADGNGTRRRDFALICGAHVYLCEFKNTAVMPLTRVPAVRSFFAALSERGCGAEVRVHALARDVNSKTPGDPNLYLLLGDLHLPPVTWFYSQADVAFPPPHEMPEWLGRTQAMARQKDHSLRFLYDRAATAREDGSVPQAKARTPGASSSPDIFGRAGGDLVHFLGALSNLPDELRRRLHFIQTGDMFELWVGREYQFVPGAGGLPVWKDPAAPNRVADWALEVMIQNAWVIEAFRRLERAGLAEVRYLEGNHDAYLRKPEVTSQLRLPHRELSYRGLSDDLFVEHGHRFDSANFDEVDGTAYFSGPSICKKLLEKPGLRKLEPMADYVRIMTDPAVRDTYLLGGTLLYLHDRFQSQQKPFSIYAMGHTHARTMCRFDVRTSYTGSYHEEGSKGEASP